MAYTGSIDYTLNNGWNLRSFPYKTNLGTAGGGFVAKTPTGLASLFTSSVSGYGTSSISSIVGEGEATTLDDQGVWIGSLTSINAKKGYWIKSSGSTATVNITNTIIEKNFNYQFNPGWNLMSYSHDTDHPMQTYLNHQSQSLSYPIFDKITGEGKAAIYTQANGWIGSLGTLEAGDGYWIHHNPSASGQNGGMNTNLYIVSESVFASGSDYVECWDGNTTQNGRLAEEGYKCNHQLYHFDSGSVSTGETSPHTFGWEQSIQQSFHFFVDYYRGTASLQRADGSEISSSADGKGPIVGFFVTSSDSRGVDICCGAGAWGGDHPQSSQTSTISDTWEQSGSGFFTTPSNELTFGSRGRYVMTMPLMLRDGYQQCNMYPTDNNPVKIKVYDPVRDKVFSAKAYKHHGGAVHNIYGIGQTCFGYMSTGSLGPTQSVPVVIRTDQ